tara:strand:+ start:66 stop:416 length:351 start_codon:yes stop_codon:yes gene_type:complete
MTTYEIIEKEVEAEMKDMDIDENNYPSRSGYLNASLIIERRDHQITRDRLKTVENNLSAQIEKLEKALDHAKDNHDVIFHNMRSMSFVDGLEMGLEYSRDIMKWNETDLSIEELSK